MKTCNARQDPVGTSLLSAHSMFSIDVQCSSGTYNAIKSSLYKQEPPHYTIVARNEMPGDTTQKPGPGNYSPEKVWLHKQQAPGYSFGIRHSAFEAPMIVEVKD